MPSSTARAGESIAHRLAAQADLAGVGRGQAEEDAGQLGPAGPDQPRQAEDLAGPDGQAHVR